jgi:hypothetical protein
MEAISSSEVSVVFCWTACHYLPRWRYSSCSCRIPKRMIVVQRKKVLRKTMNIKLSVILRRRDDDNGCVSRSWFSVITPWVLYVSVHVHALHVFSTQSILILLQKVSVIVYLICSVRRECCWRICMTYLTCSQKTWDRRSRLLWREFVQKSAEFCLLQFSVVCRYK